jgi:hypothetical protein
MDAELVADLRGLLDQQPGDEAELTVIEQLRPHVWRLAVVSSARGLPDSVIARVGPERAQGTPRPGIDAAAVFANEWAGSVFLAQLEPVGHAGPTVLACDLGAQLLIVEDLGTGPSLATLLHGADQQRAIAALREHARLLARIAAASQPRTDDYRRLRRRAGPAVAASLLDDLSSAELRRALARCETDLGIAPPTGLDAELESIDRETRTPGRWLAYTPADACPDNNVVTEDGLRLFDFGFGGLRHLALDAAYSVIPFPTCWCYAPLPSNVRDAMLTAFRSELVEALPEASDDRVWEQKLAWACGAWFVGFVGAVAVRELDRDQQRGHLSGRQVAVAQLQAIASATASHYPAISELADRLAAELRARWGITTIETYPSLERRPSS